MDAFLKKEYRLSLLLIVVFGFFLYTIDQTSEQVVSYFSEMTFRYEKPAFAKMIYLVILAISLAFMITLHKSEVSTPAQKRDAYFKYVYIGVLSFFPGWFIHVWSVIKTLKNGGSFMTLEEQWWVYNLHDITMVLGILVVGILVLRPAIHGKTEK